MSDKQPKPELATFIQHHLPGLDDGEYALEVKHEFASDKDPKQIPNGQDITDPLWYKFAVKGPRFVLDPTLIHAVFPPSNSVGEFSSVLPHVVLANETLPWSRKPVTTAANTDLDTGAFKTGDGSNHDLDIPTWLAVMIFTEGDFVKYVEPVYTMEIGQSKTGVFFGPTISDFISPACTEDPGNQPPWFNKDERCQSIKIPIDLFSSLAPSMADLFMMGNVRKVAMGSKPVQPGTHATNIGTYSIIMGNRIPVAGQNHLAVLISLEDMQDYLPDHNGLPSTSIPATVTHALLPVLTSWNFQSDGDSYRFDHLLESLNGRAVGSDGKPTVPGPLPNARLKMYAPDGSSKPSSPAAQAIDLGFVPLKHTTRNNQTTASWYRGPLAPYAFNPNAGQSLNLFKTDQNGVTTPAVYDADALVRLDPSTGLFDVSYASAWQLGRLLALQDKSFSVKLYQWKRASASAAVLAMEEEIVNGTLDVLSKLNNATEPQGSVSGSAKKTLMEATMATLIERTKKLKK